MSVEGSRSHERLLALITWKRPFSRVAHIVALQSGVVLKGLRAEGALEQTFPSVPAGVPFQGVLIPI